jgi:TetR/AcrR family transcriptional repressor of nem operon
MKTEVRDNILDIGVDIIINKGYHNVGIQEILNKANIPKGSFYHYFKNKEDFGTQIIKHYSKSALAILKSYVDDESKSPKERLIAFFKDMTDSFVSKEYREGCLIGNCSIELSDNSEVFMEAVANEFDKWHTQFEKCVLEAQKINEIKSDKSASDIADFILNSWEGALLRMKSSKSTKPLDLFLEFLTTYII